jgi:DNA-binding LacI/PurR family transcriptional regulator
MRLQGQLAAELLLRRIAAKESVKTENRVLECELIVRKSTVE